MSTLRNSAVEALDQMHSLIVTAMDASGPDNNLYDESGIGCHVRHVADHFRAFENGIDSGVIDYNCRRRDSELERNANLGLEELLELREMLPLTIFSDQRVIVESEISCLHQESRRCDSTFNRELTYLIYHTIHHVAYASLLLKQIGLSPDPDAGLAPATVSYLRQSPKAAEPLR